MRLACFNWLLHARVMLSLKKMINLSSLSRAPELCNGLDIDRYVFELLRQMYHFESSMLFTKARKKPTLSFDQTSRITVAKLSKGVVHVHCQAVSCQ